MKRKHIIIGAVLMAMVTMTSCGTKTVEKTEKPDVTNLLTEVKTTQFFTDEKVSDEDIKTILSAGINAPSAMNTQPWHFTAVTDKETTTKLAAVLIVGKAATEKDNPDAVSSATTREPFEEIVTMIGE